MADQGHKTEEQKQGGQVQGFLLRHLLPYLAIVALLCWLVDWGVREYVIFRTPMHGAAKIHRSMTRTSPEIPILGSSRALGSYLPDSLSLASYNYGVNGVGFDLVDLFLELDLARKHSKQPVVINFDYDLFKPDLGDINNYIPHVGDSRVRALLQSHDKMKWWYRLPGIRFFNSYDSYIKDQINLRVGLTKVTSLGAALEKNVIPEAQFKKLVDKRLKKPQKWVVNAEQERKLIAHFESRPDRMFYLVVAPYHWSFYESFEGMPEAQAWLSGMDARPNVRVIEVDGRAWGDSLFVNTTHINYMGAVKFTGMLRDSIFGGHSASHSGGVPPTEPSMRERP